MEPGKAHEHYLLVELIRVLEYLPEWVDRKWSVKQERRHRDVIRRVTLAIRHYATEQEILQRAPTLDAPLSAIPVMDRKRPSLLPVPVVSVIKAPDVQDAGCILNINGVRHYI